jgi:TonB family protein
MRVFAFGTAAVAATSLASTGIAQSAAPVAPQVWEVGWIESHCTISTGNFASQGLSVWMTPGDPRPDLFFLGSKRIVPPAVREKVNVRLLPGGETFTVWVFEKPSDSGTRILQLVQLGEQFPEAFARSTEIRVDGLKKSLSMTFRGSAKALTVLRQCIDTQLPKWGVDPKAYNALSMPPTATSDHMWFNDDDYPREALAAGEIGDVIARMDVDATGKVTGCAVVATSKSRSLDDRTCSTALRRGTMKPAIGADGQPVAATRIVRVIWRMGS